uniref:Uncharacterized protein n=1 Tax=Lepeophtheirus salmonis TaxID=72036 RepID=A0A0K2T476_LEPSM
MSFVKICCRDVREISNSCERCRVDVNGFLLRLSATAAMFLIMCTGRTRVYTFFRPNFVRKFLAVLFEEPPFRK